MRSVQGPPPAGHPAAGGRAVRPVLTDREAAALTAVAVGPTLEAAARRMGTSARTLRRAQAAAVRRLGAVSTAHAVALAAARGQLDERHLEARTLPDWPLSPQTQRAGARRALYLQLRRAGLDRREAARFVGLKTSTAENYDRAEGLDGPG